MGYLNRLKITLDEEDALLQDDGTIVENIGTDEPVSTVIEVGSAISAQDADDEIQEEAVSIESDLEAMQEGTDAVSELQEQNEVHEELLSQPEVITPEVAVTTQDAFVITLAKLKITPEMAFQSRISLDACARDPYRIVKITNDGVKEFLARIKEHIVAFFRTVKKKVMALIAKLAVWFSASIDKVDALIKKCNSSKIKDKKFDLSKRETAAKFFALVPYAAIPIIGSNGTYNITEYFNMLGEKLKGASTNHLEKLRDLINFLLTVFVAINTGDSSKTLEAIAKEIEDKIKLIQSAFDDDKYHTYFDWDLILEAVEKKYIRAEVTSKDDYKYSETFLAALPAGNTMSLYRIGINTERDNEIPEIFSYKANLTQTGVDKAVEVISGKSNGVYDGKTIQDMLENLRGGVKQSGAYCKAMYKHLEDAEKEITNIVNKLEKDSDSDEFKDGTLIKLVSQMQMTMAKATFENVMSISKSIKTLTAVGNLAIESIKETTKEDKADERRAQKNGTSFVKTVGKETTTNSKDGIGELGDEDVQKKNIWLDN